MPPFAPRPSLRRPPPHNATRLHETNFTKLQLVIPGIRDIAGPICLQGDDESRLSLEILEKSRYTTTFSLRLRLHQAHRWLPVLQMKVRTYHDARVAEVLAFEDHHHLQARYEYPNPRMYHRDEKRQLNHFLGDWLDHCLRTRCIFHHRPQPLDV